MATTKQPASIHQLKVTLRGIKPPIWRRLQVASESSLYTMHHILQVVMGWEGYHLYQFSVGQTNYGDPDPASGLDLRSARTAKLNRVAPAPGAKFVYVYDFGDDWEHQIVVEKVLPPESEARYPRCVAGKRAGPPEDCGGVWGYAELLEILQNPTHPEYEERMEWLGQNFDPDAFDLAEINRALQSAR